MSITLYESPFHVTESPLDAEILVLKSTFCGLIRDIISENKWSQLEASKTLEVSQPRVSDVVTGKVSKITLDRLIEMLDKLGFRLDTSELTSNKDLSITFRKPASTEDCVTPT